MFKTTDGSKKQPQVKLSEQQLAEKIRQYIQEAHKDKDRALQATEEARQIAKITQQAKEKARKAREEAKQAREKTQLAKAKAQCLVNTKLNLYKETILGDND